MIQQQTALINIKIQHLFLECVCVGWSHYTVEYSWYKLFFSLNLRIILISYHKRSGRWNRIDLPKKKKWEERKEQ